MTKERYNFIMQQTTSYFKSDEVTDEERDFIIKHFQKDPLDEEFEKPENNLNIDLFKNAKFGDKYVLRNGRIAIFYSFDNEDEKEGVNLIVPPSEGCINNDSTEFFYVSLDGSWDRRNIESENDVIGRFYISNDELDKISYEEYPINYEYNDWQMENINVNVIARDAFKEGIKYTIKNL